MPFDDADAEAFLARLPEERRRASAHVVCPDGEIWSPSSVAYRLVARHRHRLGRLVPDRPGPRRYP